VLNLVIRSWLIMLPLGSSDGILLKEVHRLLRPNGFFVYSSPPAYRKDKEYPMIWDKLVNLTSAMCWKLISRKVQTAIWIKEEKEVCLKQKAELKLISLCDVEDVLKPSWKVPLKDCVQISGQTEERPSSLAERLSAYPATLRKIGISFFFGGIIMFLLDSLTNHFSKTFIQGSVKMNIHQIQCSGENKLIITGG